MADNTNRVRLRPHVPVSHASKSAATRVYMAASAKSGQPVPESIRQLAEGADR